MATNDNQPFDDSLQKDRRTNTEDSSTSTSELDPYRQGVELNSAKHYAQGLVKIHNEFSDHNGNHEIPYLTLGQLRTSQTKQTSTTFTERAKYDPTSRFESWNFPTLSIISVSPNSGSIDGGLSVALTGSGLTYVQSVRVGATLAPNLQLVSDTVVTFDTPPKDFVGTYDVKVINPVTTRTLSNSFAYYGVPTISSLSRTIGNLEGGDTVYITGTNLFLVQGVTFDGLSATELTEISSTILSCKTPAHSNATVDVAVTTPGGTATQLSAYQYWDPTVLGVTWYLEEPDYSSNNLAGSAGSGSWSAKVGTTVGKATFAPYKSPRSNPWFKLYAAGDNDSLEYLSGSTPIATGKLRTHTGTGDSTFFAVLEHTASIRGTSNTSYLNEVVFQDFPAYQGMYLGGTSSNQLYLYRWDTAENKVNTTIGTTPGYMVIVGKILSGTMLLKVNSGSWVTGSTGVGAPGAASATSRLLVGWSNTSTSYYHGDMYMLGVDDRAWLDSECETFYNWAIQQHPRQY